MTAPAAPQATAAAKKLAQAAFTRQLNKIYVLYALGLIFFVFCLAVGELLGLSRRAIGVTLLMSTVLLYAGIGILCRTNDAAEYYVAGRRVPAVYNGMATSADWMSAASFMGLAGTLYLTGFGGLAFVMGWTGGFCLVALLLAPYLRKFGQYTIPDFLGVRYGGNLPRLVGLLATILCSFIYVVAQIYGVGLITSQLSGLAFEVGIFVGLGGILVCSFLGGMRAVTWTQVAQYVILIIAYLVPVVWLSVKQTANPVPQAIFGFQLAKVTAKEAALLQDPREREVVAIYQAEADDLARKLQDVPAALTAARIAADQKVDSLIASRAPLAEIQMAERARAALPRNPKTATAVWTRAQAAAESRAQPLGGMPRHAQPFAGDPHGSASERLTFESSRRNFLALVFCLMVGTAALPHILTRYYTTPSVRAARHSVGWSLLFISLLYFTAPALAVLVKYEIFHVLVGAPFDRLPAWISVWSQIDPALLSVVDINRDGVLQLGELRIDGDIMMLATPEIAGLPFVVSGMVAAGGLAAALSTADGLLLTISNALGHDTYFKMIDPNAPTARRVVISKVLLLVVALVAALVAAQRPANILFLVTAAFSLAGAAFFPALVLGIFWKRANKWGATLGMVAGLAVTAYYLVINHPWLRGVFNITQPIELWWGILPISAGVFGVSLGFAVIVIVSLLTPAPSARSDMVVDYIRYPRLGPAKAGPRSRS